MVTEVTVVEHGLGVKVLAREARVGLGEAGDGADDEGLAERLGDVVPDHLGDAVSELARRAEVVGVNVEDVGGGGDRGQGREPAAIDATH